VVRKKAERKPCRHPLCLADSFLADIAKLTKQNESLKAKIRELTAENKKQAALIEALEVEQIVYQEEIGHAGDLFEDLSQVDRDTWSMMKDDE